MKLGVIGAGNMGAAIIRGYVKTGANPEEIMVCGHHPERLQVLREETGIGLTDAISDLAAWCDVLLIAVKPKDVEAVLRGAAPALKKDTVLVSIAAGKRLEDLQATLLSAGSRTDRIIRGMPNTPATVGEGMTALCRSGSVPDGSFAEVRSLFQGIGRAVEIPESMMDAVTGLSGSGPAYVFLFIEALADGAVAEGMPRTQAYEFAAQTVLGAAKMVLESGQHPGELKDAVCSPGGTTIEAVRSLEENGFRSTVMNAVIAAAEKSKVM